MISNMISFAGGFLIAGYFMVNWLRDLHLGKREHDDADPLTFDEKGKQHRSNLTVLTDAKTGMQYLAVGGIMGMKSLTPRLDQNGKHMQESEG